MTFVSEQLTLARLALEQAEAASQKARTHLTALAGFVAPPLDEEKFKAFCAQPYLLLHKRGQEWHCVVPKFVDFAVGWWEFETETYNVYTVNRYSSWFGDVPQAILDDIGFEEPPGQLQVADGLLTFDEAGRATAQSYKPFLSAIRGNQGHIKRGAEFKLLARMIEDGYLPFAARPVAQTDYREPQLGFDFRGKYEFQLDAYNKFLRLGAVGVYWMTGAGKSFFGMAAMDSIKGKKLIVTPTRTLIDQWKGYLNKYAPRLYQELASYHNPQLKIVTYQAYEKIAKDEYAVVVFDECHRLPANTFARLATLKTKYRIGLSASPHREDGRENFIIALTGYPIGHDWRALIKTLGKEYHEVNVWVVPTREAKIKKTVELFDARKKTLIFSDSIELGAELSRRLKLPHVHGKTNKRIDVARKNLAFVASRVMDMGVSLDDLEHIIEVDFLFGSRAQQLQRTGRLFHSLKKSRHDILMTPDEYLKHQKRLHGLTEKGFKVNVR